MTMPRRPAGENGGVALLTLCGGLVLLMNGLLVLSAVTDVGVAAARARTAADAAALAAVSATPPTSAVSAAGGAGSGGCDLARHIVEVNGASLVTCSASGPGAVLVEVAVRPRNPLVRRLIGDLPARAAAILEPPR